LFEVVLYAVHAIGGLAALSWFRAAVAALTFTIAYLLASRDSEPPVALALSCAAFAGALATLDVRPSAMAALLVPIAIYLASRSAVVPYALLSAIWINVHPSALLAPLIGFAPRPKRIVMPLVSAAALLVNPFGWNAIVSPLKLLTFVGSGEFVNVEWLPSPVTAFPLLYILIAFGILAFATNEEWREQLWRIALFAVFAWLAARHVRNQGLFFAAFPMLVAPAVRRARVKAALAYAAAAAAVVIAAITTEHGVGPAPSRFPIASTARLQSTGLRGHVYNPDQFGGYLIWAFYPERRALTDGRNELQHAFIRDYAKARLDERAWRELLRKHAIVLAVDEYRPPIPVANARTGETQVMPASLAYWPRREWALIGYDDVSMVFARRSAFASHEQWEIRGVVPDSTR
jgi:hypothetical protein